MEDSSKVTLQITLAPTDLPHAKHILPHQLRQWAAQVDEVLLIIDTHKSHGRFALGWEERLPKLQRLVEGYISKYSNVRCLEVDYSTDTIADVSSMFLGGRKMPKKDYRGGPFYSYFFGLFASKHRYFFHIDSDLMFGGGSRTWVKEAVQLMVSRPDIFSCDPLPGPPNYDGTLPRESAERDSFSHLAFRLSCFSTRLFFLDKLQFTSKIGTLRPEYASPKGVVKALKEGNPPYAAPENIITRAMVKRRLFRVAFMGNSNGVWSLHPPQRSKIFYQQLESIIDHVERGDIPVGQRGDYDLNESFINWTTASAKGL
jgi:hypothetical protein